MLFVILFSFSVSAQTVKGVQIVKVELVTDATDFSKPFRVGLKFTIEPKWYTYWKNPGDSGLPIEVEWILPGEWEAGELLHPVPQKFIHDKIVSYGYEREVVLLTTVTPNGKAKGPVKARLEWLVCEKSCVRGTAEVRLNPGTQSEEQRVEAGRLLDSWQDQLPRPHKENPVVFQKARASMHGVGLSIEVPFESTRELKLIDFYPSSVKGIFIDYRSISVRDSKLVFNGTLEGTGTGEIYLSGLLVGADGKAYQCSVPVKFSSM